ncbi:ENR1 protein, partial [Eurystomus gularis]|nr:ENR1 protein [Eurystomus gularis]
TNELQLPGLGKNLFVDLMERIVQALNVTNCWICGGALMTEEWPWKGSSLNSQEILKWNNTQISHEHRPEEWILSSEVIGDECIQRTG